MAIKYICDSCQCEDSSSVFLKKVTIPSSATASNNSKDYELCRDCIQEIHNVLKPIPMQAPSAFEEGKV